MMLSYVHMPVLEKELDVFKNTIWNNHRGRKQKNKELPGGVPEHIYNFPQHYGATRCGIAVSDEDLDKEVAQLSNVLEYTYDYLTAEFREHCERVFPHVDEVLPNEASNAFLFFFETKFCCMIHVGVISCIDINRFYSFCKS